MLDYLAWLGDHAADLLTIASMIIAAAAAIAALTPSPKDDGIVRTLRAILDKLALNVGHAANAADAKNAPPK